MTRQQYRAFAATAAGWHWDWLHSGSRGRSDREQLWIDRSDEDARADRDEACAAALARYLATPTWSDADTHAERVAIASGRDPRRTLALHVAVQDEQAQADAKRHAERMRAKPCRGCGYAAGWHAKGCGNYERPDYARYTER